MNIQSTIVVIDASTSLPLTGVDIFVNGSSSGLTNSSGALNIQLPVGTNSNVISAKLNGYTTLTQPNVAAGSSFTVSLNPKNSPATETFTLTIYPADPAIGVPITFSNSGSPVTANYTVDGLQVSLALSQQTITGAVPGYQPFNLAVDTTVANTGTVQLVSTDPNGLAIGQVAKPADTTPSPSSILPLLTVEQLPEFVAPNTEQGTYFTMTQARMYIGGLFIDELNALQFALQDNKIPIFGYSSRFFDAVGQGKSLVQGQFTINFISEGYLYTVLQEYQKMQIQGDAPIDPIKQQSQANLLSLVNALQNPDPRWTPQQIAAAKAQIQSYAASLGPDAVTAAKQGMSATRQQTNSILGLPGGDYPNAVYSDVPFDIVIQYSGAGRTITRRLEQCWLISNESIMDHSGTPILDSYGFVSRRLR